MEIGQSASHLSKLTAGLGAERPAVGEHAGRFTPWRAPRGVQFEISGFDPSRGENPVPLTLRNRYRPGQRRRGPSSGNDAGSRPCLGEVLTHDPFSRRRQHRDEGVIGSEILSETCSTGRDIGADSLGNPTFDLGTS